MVKIIFPAELEELLSFEYNFKKGDIMKRVLLGVSLVFFVGCTTKVIVKQPKKKPSYELQHKNYKEEINDLDRNLGN